MLTEKITKYKIKEISKELDIPATTLYRWLRHENIDSIIKFLELLEYLEIDNKKFIKFYYENKKEG